MLDLLYLSPISGKHLGIFYEQLLIHLVGKKEKKATYVLYRVKNYNN